MKLGLKYYIFAESIHIYMETKNFTHRFMNNFRFIVLLVTILGSSSLFAQVYNVNFAPLDFSDGNQSLYSGTSNAPGSQVLYTNVIEINGQVMDCIVTNIDGTTGTNEVFDQNWSNPNVAPGNTTNALRVDSMFSPILSITTPGGPGSTAYKRFKFDFVTKFGSNTFYSPVILDNVVLNVYDIDREATGNVRNSVKITKGNYNQFEAISTSVAYNNSDPNVLSFYVAAANPNTNASYGDTISGITSNEYRYRFTFSNLTTFEISLGNERTSGNNQSTSDNFYYLAFSRGTGFNAPVIPANLVVDLNTTDPSPSVNNIVLIENNNAYDFTLGNRNVIITDPQSLTSRINGLNISYPTSQIENLNYERLIIDGVTGGNVDVNLSSPSSISSFTLNSQSYSMAVSTNNGVVTMRFTTTNNGTDSMTRAQAETLIDALQYKNTSIVGDEVGDRNFTVIATGTYISGGTTYTLSSPPAIFVASIPNPLPVNVISFTGKAIEGGNQLNWTVAQEENFSHYEVLRSDNGRDFNTVGSVFSNNNSMFMKSYSFVDAAANSELSYYKLRLVDNNGATGYSSLVIVSRANVVPTVSNVFPNPANTQLNVELNGVATDNMTVSIQDLTGKILYSATGVSTDSNVYSFDINSLDKGIYIIRIQDEMGNVSVSRFAVNK